jgi:hypothetical protein
LQHYYWLYLGHSGGVSHLFKEAATPARRLLGNSVTSIGDNAFSGNQLSRVTIPDSVTSIGPNAFKGNQPTSVTTPNSVTSRDMPFGSNRINKTIPDSGTSISGNRLASVTIPNSVTSIRTEAFAGNQLTSFTLPANMKITEYTLP